MRRPSKHLNIKTTVDGIEFDSKKEAARYGELKLLERAGEIRSLRLQPRFPLIVNETTVAHYKGDFAYIDKAGKPVIEDVKSPHTRRLPVYRLKVKIMAAMGLQVVEV